MLRASWVSSARPSSTEANSQPSASQRLAALERRAGVELFDRDTTGARPTAAGTEMVANAQHVLGHLELHPAVQREEQVAGRAGRGFGRPQLGSSLR